jgi:hypothetical protein
MVGNNRLSLLWTYCLVKSTFWRFVLSKNMSRKEVKPIAEAQQTLGINTYMKDGGIVMTLNDIY